MICRLVNTWGLYDSRWHQSVGEAKRLRPRGGAERPRRLLSYWGELNYIPFRPQ